MTQADSAFYAGTTKSIKELCDHCGNITHQYRIATRDLFEDSTPVTYCLYQCDICDNVILRKEWVEYTENFDGSHLTDANHEQLWPPPLALPSEVPARIRRIYQEASQVKQRSPSSFVVQIRRALEAMTKDKGAPRGSLARRIAYLIESGNLPPVFAEMTNHSRMIGNLGAHDAERDVAPEDVKIVDEFFRAVIEYIYVAPAKVKRVTDLID